MRRLLAVTLLLAACVPHSMIEVEVHPYRYAFTPPPVYRVWWTQMKACSHGAKRQWAAIPFSSIRFVMVESDTTGFRVGGDDRQLSGYYDGDTHRIYLVRGQSGERALVGHEMLHAMGYAHDRELFGQCGVRSR